MVDHNTYEIWGGLKLLKGILLGKTYLHTMYRECTGSLIQVSPHMEWVYIKCNQSLYRLLTGFYDGMKQLTCDPNIPFGPLVPSPKLT
jgi:hypothetical protein